ncbi:MAG: histidine--tRNA ligase [Armatimonadetes bacterium]|nr:histidine--tRNA ligase [Armatimonadota bacterium]
MPQLKYQRPTGTHDLYPGAERWVDDSDRRAALVETFRHLCRVYGYGEIRTPVFEATDLFTRSIGEGTDIVSKEMYTFTTKGGDSLTLRPESTAPVLRAFVENGLHARGGVTKLFYVATHFRYERPTKGRYRQHEQLGVEALGSDDPALDAEVIELALAFYRRIGISELTLKLNSVGSALSRAAYLTALKAHVEPHLGEFSEEGRARFAHNPLRMLDTKNARELEILRAAPALTEYLSDEERAHFETLCRYLQDAGVPYDLDPYLVRGFDYYTKTAFEIQAPSIQTAQNALGGGGRYNRLVSEIGGPNTPGIGFGLGIERTLLVLQEIGADMPPAPGPVAFLVTQGERARPVGVRILAELRASGISADTAYGASSMKAQLRAADRARARYAVILGDDEVAQDVVQLKSLTGGWQHAVPVAEIAEWLSGGRAPS